ncbi:hypothetical protein ACFSE1_18890 [Rhizobium helianthi]|uniref:Uncharacterized protein n=1 Tax=Rhizobium helianthi TaxID=1132695 RepID=A0ABW4M9P5_9HYPH
MELITHTNVTPRQVALELIDRLDARWNTDLKSIISNEAMTEKQRLSRLRARMLEAALHAIDQHEGMDGSIANKQDNEKLIQRVLAGDDIELEPNISVTQHNYNIIVNYTGQQVYDYVYTLSKRLEAMSNAKTVGQLAIETVSSGLFTVGTAWAKLTWTAWRGGQTILQATRTGITSLGMKTVVTVIVIVLAAILLYLFLENPKKLLGIVYNNTDENLVVKDWRKDDGDLYMEHGHMVNFMEDHATGELDSPLVQIRNRYYFGPNDEENVIFGGVYFADRNFGLRGAEGLMIFSSTTSNLRVAHQFAVPYTNDNGTNMQLIPAGSVDRAKLFRTLYDSRKTRIDVSAGGYRMISTVNDPRGGVVGLIASIQKIGT